MEHYENQKIINENGDAEKKLFTLFNDDIEYIIADEIEFKFHVRYKFFPPIELKEELKKKEVMYIGRKEKVIMKIIKEGVCKGVLNEDDVNNLVKAYNKFVFDNLIGVIFFKTLLKIVLLKHLGNHLLIVYISKKILSKQYSLKKHITQIIKLSAYFKNKFKIVLSFKC